MSFTGRGTRRWTGAVFIWLTGAALAASLLMIVGIVLLVASRGLVVFWPRPLVELTLQDGRKYVVEELSREEIPPTKEPPDAGPAPAGPPGQPGSLRSGLPVDFPVGDRVPQRAGRRRPRGAAGVWPVPGIPRPDRRKPAAGRSARPIPSGLRSSRACSSRRASVWTRSGGIEQKEIGSVNYQLERKRLDIRELERKDPKKSADTRARLAGLEGQIAELQERYRALRDQADALSAENEKAKVTFADANGTEKTIPVSAVVRFFRPNSLGLLEKIGIYLSRLWEFVSGEPRESNTEGGRLPGDLRDGHDGDPDERGRHAVRRHRRPVPAGVRPAGPPRARRADRREQPRGRAVDRVRGLRARVLRVPGRRHHRQALLLGRVCPIRRSRPAASSGRR